MDNEKFDQKKYVAEYHRTHLKKIDLRVQIEEYDDFKAACAAVGIPMATVLRRYIAEFTQKNLPKN